MRDFSFKKLPKVKQYINTNKRVSMSDFAYPLVFLPGKLFSEKSRKICEDIFLTQALDIFYKWNYNIINKWNMEAAMLKHGILGLLNYGSMTGYEINRTFKDSLSYFWNAQTSQIYRELQTLKKNGYTLIKSLTPGPSPTGEGSGMFARS